MSNVENSEIIEASKAIQETAKATNKGFETLQKLGEFISSIAKEPIIDGVGLLSDYIKVFRWERQHRLMDKVQEFNQKRIKEGKVRAVPLKIGIPIIENALLEDNDELQDLWANLLSSAQNDDHEEINNLRYVEILKQLSLIEAEILKSMREYILIEFSKDKTKNRQSLTFSQVLLMTKLGVQESQEQEYISDNLKRLELIRKVGIDNAGYEIIQLTMLGIRFTAACISTKNI
jgi:hypothetical protein